MGGEAFLDKKILASMALAPESSRLASWLVPPVQVRTMPCISDDQFQCEREIKVICNASFAYTAFIQAHLEGYGFHLQNPEAVMRGEKPIVKEVNIPQYIFKKSSILIKYNGKLPTVTNYLSKM